MEDNPGDTTLVKRGFDKYGSNLDIALQYADDGEQAIDALSRGYRPDLIMLDVNLPRIDGHGILGWIRSSEADLHPAPIVVVFSSSVRKSELQAMVEAGANQYITKPYDIDEYFAQVGEIIEKWLKPKRGQVCTASE